MVEKREELLGTHFAAFMARKSGLAEEPRERFRKLVLRLIEDVNDGHSCLPVDDEQKALLRQTELVATAGRAPLMLSGGRLYLHRYYLYERQLADHLIAMAGRKRTGDDVDLLLEQLFGADKAGNDEQRRAVRLAVENDLAIISGGPGTGKTSTVVRIIAVMLQRFGTSMQVALAAPTGKAAMRLSQSVRSAVEQLQLPGEIVEAAPKTAQTLHRLLGVRRNSPRFRHNRENPLDCDIVVIDEASMVDLALMSKTVDALKPGGRLILLGDRDQLVSVESGAVLAELMDSLAANTVVLKTSYRFNQAIAGFARAINTNRAERAWSLLREETPANLRLVESDLPALLARGYAGYVQSVREKGAGDVREVFTALSRFRILCAVRRGRFGVDNINRLLEGEIAGASGHAGNHFHGKPVMITRNDYNLGLYNGDIGICLVDPEDGVLKVWFEDEEDKLRLYLPSRLPLHETAYAMTIHKSQGSEFDEVVIVLPEEENQVLSRELLYTGVTRAREHVWLYADEKIFSTAMARKTVRNSGLAGALRERPEGNAGDRA